jgi:hypothetical protein
MHTCTLIEQRCVKLHPKQAMLCGPSHGSVRYQITQSLNRLNALRRAQKRTVPSNCRHWEDLDAEIDAINNKQKAADDKKKAVDDTAKREARIARQAMKARSSSPAQLVTGGVKGSPSASQKRKQAALGVKFASAGSDLAKSSPLGTAMQTTGAAAAVPVATAASVSAAVSIAAIPKAGVSILFSEFSDFSTFHGASACLSPSLASELYW